MYRPSSGWQTNYCRRYSFSSFCREFFAGLCCGFKARAAVLSRPAQVSCYRSWRPVLWDPPSSQSDQTISGWHRSRLSRYVVIGNVAMILFAGIGIGLCQSRAWRLACLLLIFVVMIWHNPVVVQFVHTGVLPRFRHENWREPIEQINQAEKKAQWPVFLFANILEDREANTNLDPQFQEYLLFPCAAFTKSTIPIGRFLQCKPCRHHRF